MIHHNNIQCYISKTILLLLVLVVLRLFDSLFCFVYSDKFPRWKISSPKTDMMMNDELRLLDLDNRNLTTVHPNNLDFYIIEPQKRKIIKKSYSDNFLKNN